MPRAFGEWKTRSNASVASFPIVKTSHSDKNKTFTHQHYLGLFYNHQGAKIKYALLSGYSYSSIRKPGYYGLRALIFVIGAHLFEEWRHVENLIVKN